MASDSETYNQLLTQVGGKDGPRYFHKGLMHALALIWIESRPDLAGSESVKDLLTCPSTKVNRKSMHPLQNMNNPAARAIKRKLPMKKFVKRWNKIGMKKRDKTKNKYVAETMTAFVKYLMKKVKKGNLVVNGLTDSSIEWKDNANEENNESMNDDVDEENNGSMEDNIHENSSVNDHSPWPALNSSPVSMMSEAGCNDYAENMSVTSTSQAVASPPEDAKLAMKNLILKKRMITELENVRAEINALLDSKITDLRENY